MEPIFEEQSRTNVVFVSVGLTIYETQDEGERIYTATGKNDEIIYSDYSFSTLLDYLHTNGFLLSATDKKTLLAMGK